ncbi:SPOR domain-containing protein [Sphingomonas fennica]|uniref:SPOR domain-containing protein n=1 Tax=Edaphosphingomonas fennica TaxID=114404 RepID=A0A2T4I5B5_9SPHN|nr:SPOR domain-containing protein [Sphingomonas fennica]PTD25176.1 hypothetical protein CV103_06315 [Sphingomonas fennica]
MVSSGQWLGAVAVLAAAGAATFAPAAEPADAPAAQALLAPPAPGPAAPSGPAAGVAAWKRGDYAAAIAFWRPLAEAGNADAQFNLGQAYRLGRGVAADPKAARDWYRRAAEQGHPQAQANYGLLLFDDGDRQTVLPWLQKAAERGDARALYVLGTLAFNGDPPPRDWVRAYAYMKRAAASGLPPAVNSLAEMERYIPKDERRRGEALALEMGRTAAVGQTVIPAMATEAAAAPVPAAKAAKDRKAKVAAPDRSPAATAASPSTSGGWRIQLGAFSDAARADGLWQKLRNTHAVLADKQSFLIDAGAVTRLQAGPFPDHAAADRACAALAAHGQACFTTR